MPYCPMGIIYYRFSPGTGNIPVSGAGAKAFPGPAVSNPALSSVKKSAKDLKCLMHLLWSQHVYWTRMFIISAVFGLPDIDPTTERLLRNPEDFRAALRPFYGAGADRLADLLREHLLLAAQLVKAAKAGDSKAAADAERRWYANADEIAAYLGSINPYWTVDEWRSMLYEHLALTKKEAVEMLAGKYADSISTFDDVEREALVMAEVMADGLIRQFGL